MEPLIPLAIKIESNEIVFVDEVLSGAACNCVCISCGVSLVAKKGKVNVHHFSHEAQKVNSEKLCEFSIERAIYLMIAKILVEEGKLLVPSYNLKFSKPLLNILVEGSLVTEELVSIKLIENESNLEMNNDKNVVWLESKFGIFALTVNMNPKLQNYSLKASPEYLDGKRIAHLILNLAGLVQEFLNHKRGYKALLTSILIEKLEGKAWIYHPDQDPLRMDYEKQLKSVSFANIRSVSPQAPVKKSNRQQTSSTSTLVFETGETETRLNELINQVNKLASSGFQEGNRCLKCYFMNNVNDAECYFCTNDKFEKTVLSEDYLYCLDKKYNCWLYPMYSLQALRNCPK